jgi:hypothetical protein
VLRSPLIALSLPDLFDAYVFCDAEPESRQALDSRVRRTGREQRVFVVPGDANPRVDDREALLTHFDFPAEHWLHIRTTNLVVSPFATVRLRQQVTKGPAPGRRGSPRRSSCWPWPSSVGPG